MMRVDDMARQLQAAPEFEINAGVLPHSGEPGIRFRLKGVEAVWGACLYSLVGRGSTAAEAVADYARRFNEYYRPVGGEDCEGVHIRLSKSDRPVVQRLDEDFPSSWTDIQIDVGRTAESAQPHTRKL